MGARPPGRLQPLEPRGPRIARAGAEMCLRLGGPSLGDSGKVLMKQGLVLVVLGHLSFITAALLHGTVLRYVVTPGNALTLQYCVINILSVTSAIMFVKAMNAELGPPRALPVITSGITTIILSRYLSSVPLRWTVFSLSVACALLALTCALGLLASIAKTFATQGKALLAACTLGSPELMALASNCPFDPTRIYSSSLCLWGISLVLCVAETVFAMRCAQFSHQLLGLRPWCGKSYPLSLQESPEPVEGRDLLSCTSSEPLTL